MNNDEETIKTLNSIYYKDATFRNLVDAFVVLIIEGVEASTLQDAVYLAFDDACKRWDFLKKQFKRMDEKTITEMQLMGEDEKNFVKNKITQTQLNPDVGDTYTDMKTGLRYIFTTKKEWMLHE